MTAAPPRSPSPALSASPEQDAANPAVLEAGPRRKFKIINPSNGKEVKAAGRAEEFKIINPNSGEEVKIINPYNGEEVRTASKTEDGHAAAWRSVQAQVDAFAVTTQNFKFNVDALPFMSLQGNTDAGCGIVANHQGAEVRVAADGAVLSEGMCFSTCPVPNHQMGDCTAPDDATAAFLRAARDFEVEQPAQWLGSREVYVEQTLDAHGGDEPRGCLAGVQLPEHPPPPGPEAEDVSTAHCLEALKLQDIAHSVALAALSIDSRSASPSPTASPRGLVPQLLDPCSSFLLPGHATALPPVLGTVGAAPGGRLLPGAL